MAMITKAQAATIFNNSVTAAQSSVLQRLNDAIITAAANGITSITFNYFPVASATVDAFITSTMTPAGWTVVNNNIATPGSFTITVS